jgi:hypothetical protein
MGPVEMSETIIPFAPSSQREKVHDDDPLDQTGQNVLGMLQQAAVAAKQNCQHAVDVAHKLSLQLRTAEDRIKNLEAEVSHYQERAARAEQWLLRISRDIEQRFLEPDVTRHRQTPGRSNSPFGRRLEAAE